MEVSMYGQSSYRNDILTRRCMLFLLFIATGLLLLGLEAIGLNNMGRPTWNALVYGGGVFLSGFLAYYLWQIGETWSVTYPVIFAGCIVVCNNYGAYEFAGFLTAAIFFLNAIVAIYALNLDAR